MLGIISVKNSEMIDIGEAMSDYLLYKGKLAPYTPSPSLRPHHIVVLFFEILDTEWRVHQLFYSVRSRLCLSGKNLESMKGSVGKLAKQK